MVIWPRAQAHALPLVNKEVCLLTHIRLRFILEHNFCKHIQGLHHAIAFVTNQVGERKTSDALAYINLNYFDHTKIT